jgi:membrane protein DedA with SNARE-associated domain
LLQLIVEYRYWILLPLSFLEGPLVAFVAGTLASAGYFNIFALAVFFLGRDVTVDLVCYFVGYLGGQALWVQRLLARLGVGEQELDDVRALWHTHPGKTMFLSKLSYGVAGGFMIIAGLVRMPRRTFLGYGSLIAVLHYGLLLVAGYFFGTAFGGTIIGIFQRISQAVLGFSAVALTYYLVKRRIRRTLRDREHTAAAS